MPAGKPAAAQQPAAHPDPPRNPSHEDGAADVWTEVTHGGKRKATPTSTLPATLATNQGGSASSSSSQPQANQANPDENEDSSGSSSGSSASSDDDDSGSDEEEEEEEEEVVHYKTTTPNPPATRGTPKYLQKFIARSLEKAHKDGTEPPAWVFKLIGVEDPASQHGLMEQVNPTNLAIDLAAEPTSSRGSGLVGATEKRGQGLVGAAGKNRVTPASSSNTSTVSPAPGSARTTTETHSSLAESNSPLPPSTTPVCTDMNMPVEHRSTTPVRTDTIMPVERRSLENAKFQLKQTDIPADLKLEGLPQEDIPEKMALY